eukprot:5405254-Prymnesium_polylepis.1
MVSSAFAAPTASIPTPSATDGAPYGHSTVYISAGQLDSAQSDWLASTTLRAVRQCCARGVRARCARARVAVKAVSCVAERGAFA